MDMEKSTTVEVEAAYAAPATKDIEEHHEDVRIRHVKNKEEKRLVLKQDLLILPLLSGAIFLGYLVSQ